MSSCVHVRCGWLIAGVASCLWSLAGCNETYCQSGAKYGTQCPTINEIEWQETQVRGGPPETFQTQPAPGCVMATPKGFVRQPLPQQAGSAAPPPQPPALYLMSGACVTRRQTAHGAVR